MKINEKPVDESDEDKPGIILAMQKMSQFSN